MYTQHGLIDNLIIRQKKSVINCVHMYITETNPWRHLYLFKANTDSYTNVYNLMSITIIWCHTVIFFTDFIYACLTSTYKGIFINCLSRATVYWANAQHIQPTLSSPRTLICMYRHRCMMTVYSAPIHKPNINFVQYPLMFSIFALWMRTIKANSINIKALYIHKEES